MVVLLSIEYGNSQSSYKYIRIEGKGISKRFDTGDPIIDWINHLLWRYTEDIPVIMTSSVNNWFVDGDEYFQLILDDNYNPITWDEIKKLPPGKVVSLPTFISKGNIKTISDLCDYYLKKTGKPFKIIPITTEEE